MKQDAAYNTCPARGLENLKDMNQHGWMQSLSPPVPLASVLMNKLKPPTVGLREVGYMDCEAEGNDRREGGGVGGKRQCPGRDLGYRV